MTLEVMIWFYPTQVARCRLKDFLSHTSGHRNAVVRVEPHVRLTRVILLEHILSKVNVLDNIVSLRPTHLHDGKT